MPAELIWAAVAVCCVSLIFHILLFRHHERVMAGICYDHHALLQHHEEELRKINAELLAIDAMRRNHV